jgi:hypothetical protein
MLLLVIMDNLSCVFLVSYLSALARRGWRHTLHLMSLLRKRKTTPEKWLQHQAAPERKIDGPFSWWKSQ